jgi:hypothetical protein
VSVRNVPAAAIVAAVALLTAETNEIDIDPAELIGDVEPLEVVRALIVVGGVLSSVLTGVCATDMGLRSAGLVAAQAVSYEQNRSL